VVAGRGEALAGALIGHLRTALGAPALELAEPPVALRGGFDTEIYALRLGGAPPAFAGPLVLRVFRARHDPAVPTPRGCWPSGGGARASRPRSSRDGTGALSAMFLAGSVFA
jgi:hypothetical protein